MNLSLFIFVIMVSALLSNSIQAQEKLVPFKGRILAPPPTQRQARPTDSNTYSCKIAGLNLPKDTVVFAAGAYSGYPLDRQIDQSGHAATQMDITVNSKLPVALLLGAYEPTIWNIGWTEKTKIVAIFAGGYHRQILAGLKSDTPSLASYLEENGPCGRSYFYLAPDQLSKINEISKSIFGKTVDTAFAAKDGVAIVGDPLSGNEKIFTSDWKKIDSFFDANAPLAGKAGLEDAVKKGLIRQATDADTELVMTALEKEKGPPSTTKLVGMESPKRMLYPIGPNGAYTVLKKFTYPTGLFGGNSAAFIILKGIPTPDGTPGHSIVFDLNKSPICQGPICRINN